MFTAIILDSFRDEYITKENIGEVHK